jgi:tetratricopeptide (TPR) repeat protein
MNFIRKLFQRGSSTTKQGSSAASGGNDQIRAFDEFGREVLIDREAWRGILSDNIKKAWDDPDGLYGLIINAINDGFLAEVVNAAERLTHVDPDRQRSACVYGVLLLEQGNLEAAERVFSGYLSACGEEGYILSNLAKVYSRRGDSERADRTLWRALEVDPNQDNGLSWFVALEKERHGEGSEQAAYRKVAAIKGSWRAQLGLARAALAAEDVNEAVILYRHALAQASRPVPADLLMQISGDLGNGGCVKEIAPLVRPEFDPAFHGITVGNNLIKAYTDLGEYEEARSVLESLWAQKRPDWKQALQFWDAEVARNLAAAQPARDASPAITLGVISGPVWLTESSEANSLIPAKPADEYLIGFLSGTVQHPAPAPELQAHLADDVGAASRALPLFFSEQAYMHSRARTQALVPWVSEPSGGFAVFGARASDHEAVSSVKTCSYPFHRLVALHIDVRPDVWDLEVRILRPDDESCAATMRARLDQKAPASVVQDLARDLVRALVREAGVKENPPPSFYRLPDKAHMPGYVGRLGQLLAVRCAVMTENHDFLYGVREMIDGSIRLCLDNPSNPTTRLLLMQLLLSLKACHPDAVAESADTLRKLQERHPVSAPADGVIQRMLESALKP